MKNSEQSLFKHYKRSAKTFCIIVVSISLTIFFGASIKYLLMPYNEQTYHSFGLLATCGIPIPHLFCHFLIKRYCNEVEKIKVNEQIFFSEEHIQKNCDVISDPVDKITCISVIIILVLYLTMCYIYPGILMR